jgi:ABC-type antimicrobial peptide transport system permease subunit
MTTALLRAEIRSRLPSIVALALLVGLGTGFVMTTAAGARRTDSSYRRFSSLYKAADMMIYPAFDEAFAALDFDRVEKLPQVLAAARYRFIFNGEQTGQLAVGDARYGVDINRSKVLDGRMPRPDRQDEVALAFTFAKNHGLHVGSRLTLQFSTGPSTKAFPTTFRVVGIEATPGEFPPQLSGFGNVGTDAIHVTPAFYRSAKEKGVFSLDALLLRFRRGAADVPAVVAELNRMAKDKPQLNLLLGDQAANVQRSIHLQAVALWIVGALVAIIGSLVLAQLLARQAVIDSNESPTLLALGMTRTQIWLTGMGRSGVVGLAGACIGVVVAVVASPLMPIGTARIAEPHPGVSFDPLVIGIGSAAALIGVLALAALPLWKSAGAARRALEASSVTPSRVARLAARPGFSPSMATGMRLALEPGRGASEVPVRSSLLSVTLAIAALASALTFAAGLDHLLASPRLYGWNWDAHITNNSENGVIASARKVLQSDANIEAVAFVDTPPLLVAGTERRLRLDGLVLQQVKDSIRPVVIDGRAPTGADEVALGAKTLRDAGARIGSTVNLEITAIQGKTVPLRVVGTVVLPPNSDSARLGTGAIMTIEAEKTMIPPTVQAPPLTDAYVRFASGIDKTEALRRLRRELESEYGVLLPSRPTDLVNFGQVQNLPLLLAGLVALLAAATLAHTLITSIRRRRRDLAILRTLGFVPSQVRWTIGWQATTFVSVTLLIGLPLGVAIGRVIWAIFARQIGTMPEQVTPSVPLLLTIPAAIFLANLIAAVPGVIAARMKPAIVLRGE